MFDDDDAQIQQTISANLALLASEQNDDIMA